MIKLDWAERKVHTVGATVWEGMRYFHEDAVVRLLKAERRRAVRKCREQAKMPRSMYFTDEPGYKRACSDCAQAIAGGK